MNEKKEFFLSYQDLLMRVESWNEDVPPFSLSYPLSCPLSTFPFKLAHYKIMVTHFEGKAKR